MVEHLASAIFVRDLRHALLHLYDAAELRRSPLVALLGLEQREDPPSALRRLLLQDIAALKPPPDVAAQAGAWRTYQVLSLRYTEQYSQAEVAADLSLSIRQVRRQDNRALRALADYLWVSHDLQHAAAEVTPAVGPEAAQAENGTPSREAEMEWLRQSLPSETADVALLVQGALRTVAPLVHNLGLRLECEMPEGLPPVTAPQAAIRQALLNALTAACHCAAGGRISLEVQSDPHSVRIRICPARHPAAPASLCEHDRERLEMAGQLARLAGGDLLLRGGDGQLVELELALPAAEQVPVLVIDDNADTLELMRRYLAGTRYRYLAARDPAVVLSALEPTPGAILLDVMLPGVDGWELLERLREHPRTRGVPIIVCTILPQEELALALGAAAFLRKPVSRQSLLTVLDRQSGRPATGPA